MSRPQRSAKRVTPRAALTLLVAAAAAGVLGHSFHAATEGCGQTPVVTDLEEEEKIKS